VGLRNTPAALPVLSLLIGTDLAFRFCHESILLAGVLLALGLALRTRLGAATALLAWGLLGVWARPELAPEPPAEIDLRSPVTVTGRLDGRWKKGQFGWAVRVLTHSVYQRDRVFLWRQRIYLSLSGKERPPESYRLRLRGYLGRAPGLGNDPRLPPGPWRLQVKSQRFLEVIRSPDPPVKRLADALHAAVDERLEEARDSGAAVQVVRALILGDSSALDRRLSQGLRRSGLAHLFAISGLHVGLLATLTYFLLAPLPRGWRVAGAALGVVIYLALVGPRPSLLRACLMAGIAWLSLGMERRPQVVQALALSLGGMVLIDPALIRDLGFLLTASATGGVAVLAPEFSRRWTALPAWLSRPIAVSLGAQIGSLPWVLTHFGLLHPASAILNLVAIPWLAVTLAVSLCWTAISLVSESAASLTLPVLEGLSRPLEWIAGVPPSPLLTWPVDLRGIGAVSLAAALAVFFLWTSRASLRLAAMILAVRLTVMPLADRAVELTMIDVGQGDAFLLRDAGRAILVDGGGWQSADIGQRVLLPALARKGIRRLEAVVMTHPDLDHCRGLLDIAAYVRVRELWSAPGRRGLDCPARLTVLPGVRWRRLWAGESLDLGRWRLRVLHPPAGSSLEGNNGSLVLQAIAMQTTVLLTGDIEASAEREILAREGGAALASDVLKVAHHGSRTSTSPPFLAATSPRLALLSVGRKNRYRHPAPTVVERLEEHGSFLFRTDHHGMVEVRLAGKGSMRVSHHGP
jgi:competence protein ComEC